jgi:ABC-type transporter Mla subunit MlaD
MPFHRDATCAIRPEGLIAENYIDCDPGTADSPPLPAREGEPPTVPVQNTTEPVSLLDLFNMFNLPTRERLQVLVNELGIGTAARGADFNDILRRANPALALARQAIGILARQKAQLATIVDATDAIAAQGAAHAGALQRFLDGSAALTEQTAQHRDQLAQAVARLPGLLAQAQPALEQLDTVAVGGTPLVAQLHQAVPALNRVAGDLGPFVRAAQPALAQMGRALEQAIPALRNTTPLVSTLRAYTKRSLPGTQLFARLAENLQQHGFVENFLKVTYSIGASLARFDSTSHMLSILLVGPKNGMCGNYATKPVPGCSAHYGQQPAYKPSRSRPARPAATRRARPPARGARRVPSPPRAVAGKRGRHPGAVLPPAVQQIAASAPAAVGQSAQTLQSLVNYLLR